MEKQCSWKMFDRISSTYDFTNRILSFGIDRLWRKKLRHYLPEKENIRLLDCATGTADQILSLIDQVESAVGIDLAQQMLSIGRRKTAHLPVTLECASATDIPYVNHSFDCVTISFGIRNIENVSLALKEMHRVLSSNGRALILEFSLPRHTWIRKAYLFYLRHWLPRIGSFISKNREAYEYLNQTIETFPSGKAFCTLLEQAGFVNVQECPLTFGIATLYIGSK